jgi:hypothetical protein
VIVRLGRRRKVQAVFDRGFAAVPSLFGVGPVVAARVIGYTGDVAASGIVITSTAYTGTRPSRCPQAGSVRHRNEAHARRCGEPAPATPDRPARISRVRGAKRDRASRHAPIRSGAGAAAAISLTRRVASLFLPEVVKVEEHGAPQELLWVCRCSVFDWVIRSGRGLRLQRCSAGRGAGS